MENDERYCICGHKCKDHQTDDGHCAGQSPSRLPTLAKIGFKWLCICREFREHDVEKCISSVCPINHEYIKASVKI